MKKEEIREIVEKNKHKLTKTVTRCFYEDEWQEVQTDVDAVCALVEECLSRAEVERDAARYRFLRDSSNQPEEMDGADAAIVVGYAGGESLLSGEQLDAAIDAMLTAAEAPNGAKS